MRLHFLRQIMFPYIVHIYLTHGPTAYLTERQHHTTLPLSALADTRLGIDAGVYLGGLLVRVSSHLSALFLTCIT